MFQWNIAKSAEAMFSRWAIKRVCKFLLKKKLGKFILGDIDLNQLDVQLSAGTIQLFDLAINVDYLNEKFGAKAGVIVKEGSIGSLLVTMPWKEDGCRIDINELEIVISPCSKNVSEVSTSGQQESQPNSGTHDHEGVNNAAKSTTFDVHEGVKTVAKMVKWLLTSFHVNIKKLIIAFDPCLEEEKKSTLVLRISEIECGTRISDDKSTSENFLGLTYLTNFVKFQGAILEFLQLDSVDNQNPLNSTTQIITSEKGGFSGNLKVSIPWKNGSLDIHKVDAEAYIDPLEFRVQPSTIKRFISLWDVFKNINNIPKNEANESIFYSASSKYETYDKSNPDYQNSISERIEKELASDSILSESHLISDYVSKSHKPEEEPDFGESVHQFFECFDGLRNSQSALGNSGVWNWTCSVFSAITATSNLASGSLYIPPEQPHIETNFKAKVSEISLIFSFIDEDYTKKTNTKASIHYVNAKFQDILLVLQVCPRETNFEAKVEHIIVSDHFSCENENLPLNTQRDKDVIKSQISSIKKIRDGVNNALPSFYSSNTTKKYEKRQDLVKVLLLETFGISEFKIRVSSDSSFSLKLPCFVLWMNIDFLIVVLNLVKEVECFYSLHKIDQTKSSSHVTSTLKKESFRGDIYIPNGRIIICFPSEKCVYFRSYSSCLHFITLDLSSYKNFEASKPRVSDSLHLNLGYVDAYLITSASEEYTACKIVSIGDKSGTSSPIISVYSQEHGITGPWIAKRAKFLASAENIKGRDLFHKEGSVTTVKDVEDFDTRTREEMISSSKTFVRVNLPPVTVNLTMSTCENLRSLVQKVNDSFACIVSESESESESESVISQECVLLECDSIEILFTMEVLENVKGSIQTELPGSWHKLRLKIRKFEVLSVSNIGGVKNGNFFWISHREGNLYGSVTRVLDEEFVLISCNDSSLGRGDGEGSNVLSSKLSGSDIIFLWDPENLHSYTSIVTRSCTIVAIGGRLDWFESIGSIFQESDEKSEIESKSNSKSTFTLNFVDFAVKYDPYLNTHETIMCLLAVSSLKVSNITTPGDLPLEYRIRLRDLGLLVSEGKSGYVKIAQNAHFEALLKIDSMWEIECFDTHVVINTCHDTFTALIRLSSQLQKIYAPDIEESAVHLQNRWNNIHQTHEFNDNIVFSNSSDSKSDRESLNLMDDICEDAFQISGTHEIPDLHFRFSLSESYLDKRKGSKNIAQSVPVIEENCPQLIEEYFFSDLRPLSELKTQPSGNSGWYGNSSLKILENHVPETNKKTNLPLSFDHEGCTSKFEKVKGRVLLKNMNVIWRLYDGSDWSMCRDISTCLELTLSGIELKYEVFPNGAICVSKISLSIRDFYLLDNSNSAAWKLVLGYYESKKHPRRSSSKSFKMDLDTIRPDPSTPLEEYRLRIAILPMLLHLHQSQLDFLISFFGGKNTPGESENVSNNITNLGNHIIIEEALLPYFQKFDISPVLIRVDYSPCRVDLAALRGGKYVELVNLVPWKGVELQLKSVQAVGIYGWNSIFETIIGEWLEDISQNQVHKLLKGLPPIRSLVAVGSGAAKLVSLPIKNYRKDQRLVKGMQRGTIAFLRSISVEAIGLGVHLAAGAHEILMQAEYLLRTVPPSVTWVPRENVRSNQPNDAREGIQQACESISQGFSKSASNLVQKPMQKYQRGGGVGPALATAVQAAPGAAIAPASATARAMYCALLGVRNSLDPEHKKESLDKYSGTNQPH